MKALALPIDTTPREAFDAVHAALPAELRAQWAHLAKGQDFTKTKSLARLFGVNLIPSYPRRCA